MLSSNQINNSLIELINAEQLRQNGRYIPNTDYLKKIMSQAELVTHCENNKVVGFIFYYCNDYKEKASYITLIGTDPSVRGKGVAQALLNYVLNITKIRGFSNCLLEVRKENHTAFKFYQKNGFFVTEERSDKFLMKLVVE